MNSNEMCPTCIDFEYLLRCQGFQVYFARASVRQLERGNEFLPLGHQDMDSYWLVVDDYYQLFILKAPHSRVAAMWFDPLHHLVTLRDVPLPRQFPVPASVVAAVVGSFWLLGAVLLVLLLQNGGLWWTMFIPSYTIEWSGNYRKNGV